MHNIIKAQVKNVLCLPRSTAGKLFQAASKTAFKNLLLRASKKSVYQLTGFRRMASTYNEEQFKFFINYQDKDDIINFVRQRYPDSIAHTLKDADDLLDHQFNLLGADKKSIGKGIDWNYDFKHNFRWDPLTCYLKTDDHIKLYLKNGIRADVKVPWELSRFQHLTTIGKAYWYTGDEKYAVEFKDQITDWIQKNQIGFGVNWTCTMDVAIRAVNWLWGFFFFYDSETIDEQFKEHFLKQLFLHGVYIFNNLENGRIRGNHYLSDIVGLIYLGFFFKNTIDGNRWLDYGIQALMNEMKHQVYDDGVDFEGTVHYHCLVTELFISPTLLCLKNGVMFPEWYMKKLERMIDFIMYSAKPNGESPVIGDQDDGRLHILETYYGWSRLNRQYLLSIGTILFDNGDFKSASNFLSEEGFWLTGLKGVQQFDNIKDKNTILGSKAYSHGGYYVMRDGDLFMLVDAIPPDHQAPSGHKHNSRLSFELYAYGKSLIVDPGAYTYTSNREERNLFRSTKYHNTVVVDDQEQCSYANDLFTLDKSPNVKVNMWETTSDHDLLDIEHDGFARLDDPIIHRRKIIFDKRNRFWVIRDLLTGSGRHKFDMYFHVSATSKVSSLDRHIIRINNGKTGILIIPLEVDKVKDSIENGYVSSGYGQKEPAYIVRYSGVTCGSVDLTTILYPFQMDGEDTDFLNRFEEFGLRDILRILSD
ncbi:alginate lyase family protein [Methanocella sp. MCL-LM]|uniref:alginate lyase family protein n=1 Tax=Methanocella sp. MCL-LM TaxID=3412035 RepID=UPI003C759041